MVTDAQLDLGGWEPDDSGPMRGSFRMGDELVTWERRGDTLHYRTSRIDVELN